MRRDCATFLTTLGRRPGRDSCRRLETGNIEDGAFRTRFGGLFVFVPMLAALDLDRLLDEAAMPGSAMIPAPAAWRALLALKLWGIGRPAQAMAEVFDPGLALFAGLKAMPKRPTLTE